MWPLSSDVRLGVTYGPTGAEYTGTMAEGGGTYPTAESIAAAVVSALQGTTIPVNIKQVNDGDGILHLGLLRRVATGSVLCQRLAPSRR